MKKTEKTVLILKFICVGFIASCVIALIFDAVNRGL